MLSSTTCFKPGRSGSLANIPCQEGQFFQCNLCPPALLERLGLSHRDSCVMAKPGGGHSNGHQVGSKVCCEGRLSLRELTAEGLQSRKCK